MFVRVYFSPGVELVWLLNANVACTPLIGVSCTPWIVFICYAEEAKTNRNPQQLILIAQLT